MSEQDEKTRVTQVVQATPPEQGTGSDCLVVIYTAEPGLLGKRFVLDRSPLRVGRGTDNHIVLEGDSVSRRHAHFERRGTEWYVVDDGSIMGQFASSDATFDAGCLALGEVAIDLGARPELPRWVVVHGGGATNNSNALMLSPERVDASSHAQDTYSFRMLGGYCYRFFVVGDPGLDVIDVRVHRPNGALLSMVETKQGVAILDPKEPWCKKHDRDFQVVIEARSGSKGGYSFGIWARPNH